MFYRKAPSTRRLQQLVRSDPRVRGRITAASAFLSANVIWEAVKRNLESSMLSQWPWRLTLLDLAPSVTLLSGIVALWFARSQFSKSVQPHISWSAKVGGSDFVEDSKRTIRLFNAGHGRAIVRNISYRYSLSTDADQAGESEWMRWGYFVEELERHGMERGKDFFIMHIGVGLSIRPMGSQDDRLEVAALGSEVMSRLRTFDVKIEYLDALDGEYQVVMQCLGIWRFAEESWQEHFSRCGVATTRPVHPVNRRHPTKLSKLVDVLISSNRDER